MNRDRALAVDRLREELASRGLASYVPPGRLETGIPALDRQVGGWPAPGVAEVAGLPGSGRLGLVLPALVRETRQGRLAAVVDPRGLLHPPGLPGVRWSRLLLVRASPERAVWATEQLLQCGGVALTVLLDPYPLGRTCWRLSRAAEQGGTTLVVLGETPDPGSSATLRLQVEGGRVRVTRSRRGQVAVPVPISAPLQGPAWTGAQAPKSG